MNLSTALLAKKSLIPSHLKLNNARYNYCMQISLLNKMLKRVLFLGTFNTLLLATEVTPTYTFLNASLNYLDWSKSTEKSTLQDDFFFLELEGGAEWDFGEFYFFADIENPHQKWSTPANDNLRIAFKPIADIKIAKSKLYLHLQEYYYDSKPYYISNSVLGLSSKYSYKTFWIIPFFGAHYQKSSDYSGFNGYMYGWTLNYDTTIFNESFSISQWNEFESQRKKEDYIRESGGLYGNEKSYGVNGLLSLLWHIRPDATIALQYQYAKYKFGFKEYQDAYIYTIRYDF